MSQHAMTQASLPAKLSLQVKEEAHRLGFELVGISPVKAPPHEQSFADWLRRGLAGELGYMERTQALRRNPRDLAQALVVGVACPVVDERRHDDQSDDQETQRPAHQRLEHPVSLPTRRKTPSPGRNCGRSVSWKQPESGGKDDWRDWEKREE